MTDPDRLAPLRLENEDEEKTFARTGEPELIQTSQLPRQPTGVTRKPVERR
jgi:hypothetical protein